MADNLRIANVVLTLTLILQILVWTFRERPSPPAPPPAPQPASSADSSPSTPKSPDEATASPTATATPEPSPSSPPVAATSEKAGSRPTMETASDGNASRSPDQTEGSAGNGKKESTGGRRSDSESRQVSRVEAAGARSDVGERLSQLGLTPARFQIALLWDSDADLDLHVITASGERLWRQDRDSPSGGRFQSTAADTKKPLETVYWADQDEPTWPVTVEVRYPPSENESSTSVDYRVVISFHGGAEKAYSGKISPSRAIKLGPFDRNIGGAD